MFTVTLQADVEVVGEEINTQESPLERVTAL